MKIKINCEGTHYFGLDELHVLQDGEGYQLKELTEENFSKLLHSIEQRGFTFPFFFWYCEEEEKNYFLDGTQRNKVLEWMIESGEYELPEKYPAVRIYADSKKEAAESILLQSAAYGKITDDGLLGFITEFEINLDDLKTDLILPEINLEEMDFSGPDLEPEKEPPGDPTEPGEPDEDRTVPLFIVISKQEHKRWKEIKKERSIMNDTDLLIELMREYVN